MLAPRLLLVAALLVVAGLGWGLLHAFLTRAQLQSDLARQLAVAEARFAVLQKQFKMSAQQAAALAGELNRQKGQAQNSSAPPTGDALTARLKALAEMADAGRLAEALAGALELYHASTAAAGRSQIASFISSLARPPRSYEPTAVALRELRDAAAQEFAARPSDADLPRLLALMNTALRDQPAMLALYDAIPAGDSRRRYLSPYTLTVLIDTQRYADALQERTLSNMLSLLDAVVTNSPNLHGTISRAELIEETATGIEVLTGLSRSDEARMLTEKLLQYDSSDSTREIIRQHIERAIRH